MQVRFMLLISILFISLSVKGQKQEYETVRNMVSNYFVGWETKDAVLLNSIFHQNCKVKYLNREKDYQEVLIGKHIEEITHPDNKFLPPHIRDVNAVNISGDAASALVNLRFRTFEVTDFFSLLRINNQWKIVNKVSVSKMLPKAIIDEN